MFAINLQWVLNRFDNNLCELNIGKSIENLNGGVYIFSLSLFFVCAFLEKNVIYKIFVSPRRLPLSVYILILKMKYDLK